MLMKSYLVDHIVEKLHEASLIERRGRIFSASGRIIKASLAGVKIGELCELRNPDGTRGFAEVIGIQKDLAILSPLGELMGVSTTTEICPLGKSLKVKVGPELLGKVLDGMGRELSGTELPFHPENRELSTEADPPNPLARRPITETLATGIKAIDGLLAVGEGQRLGIFAPAGVGKSTLLAELTKGTSADVVVCALVGERGREVKDFIDNGLGGEGMEKAVLVVATSDRPPLERLKAAHVAMTIAEHFRDQGLKVLFLMDSITRYARALREIGIQVGEPPARRGYPPSVFAALPRLVERAGNGEVGSITGFYTILVEGDDETDPIAEEMRSLLDGHILLSRKLAHAGQYPAIDVLSSISRVMNHIVSAEQSRAANRMRELMAKYKEIELLVNMGEYKRGSDPVADEAISMIRPIKEFLTQGISEHQDAEITRTELSQLMGVY